MGIEASAYAILGLRPGADRAAIDEAYRRLIKQHHPDRSGGDASRAAEINRAYFELRGNRSPTAPRHAAADGDIGEAIYARRAARSPVHKPVRRRRRLWPLAAALVLALLVVQREAVVEAGLDLQDQVTGGWRAETGGAVAPVRAASAAEPIDGDLSGQAIGAAIERARRLARAAAADEPVQASRECHREMRTNPAIEQLDRCAAFDYAVSLLEDRDPVSDQGPFGATAVTARQMAAASLLSNDFLAIEGRLDRIRARVEMALAPPPLPMPRISAGEPAPAPPAPVLTDQSGGAEAAP